MACHFVLPSLLQCHQGRGQPHSDALPLRAAPRQELPVTSAMSLSVSAGEGASLSPPSPRVRAPHPRLLPARLLALLATAAARRGQRGVSASWQWGGLPYHAPRSASRLLPVVPEAPGREAQLAGSGIRSRLALRTAAEADGEASFLLPLSSAPWGVPRGALPRGAPWGSAAASELWPWRHLPRC